MATGDIVMGSTPNLPEDGGRSFFSDVQTDLAGDVVLGNLEGTLSSGGSSKCGPAQLRLLRVPDAAVLRALAGAGRLRW